MKQFLRYYCTLLLMSIVCSSALWAAEVTDVLDRELTGVTGTSYVSWSGKEATSSAVYAGQSAGGNNSIQLRSSNSNSGVVTTTSGGKVKKITVTWNSNTASGRVLNVYGSNTAYTAATDLYSSTKQGTLLGTIVNGTSTELTIDGDYEYIGFRSNSGAVYLEKVEIVWEDGTSTGGGEQTELIPTVTTIDASGITNTNFYNGAKAGQLSATVKTQEGEDVDVTVEWSSQYPSVATVDDNGVVTLVGTGTTIITAKSLADETHASSTATYELTVTYDDPNIVTLWSEDFSDYSANEVPSEGVYNYSTASLNTKIYAANLAGGTSPELLVAKNGGSFSATIPLEDVEGDLTLTYRTNNANLTVSSASDVTLTGDVTATSGTNTVTISGVTSGMTSLELTFANSNSSNVRLDDILLVGVRVVGGKEKAGLSFGETTKFTVNVNDEFTAPALTVAEGFDGTVVYSSSDENLAIVDESTGEVLIGENAGVVTITATSEETENFRAGSASYTITIVDPNAPGTANNPYTVAEARAAIDANAEVNEVYAKGIVSAIVTAYNSEFGNITYDISADGSTTSDQLRVYRGKSYNGDNFTSEDDIQVGDEVVVYGNLTLYDGSTYEFAANNQLVSLVRPVTPVISYEQSSTDSFSYEEGYGPSDSRLVEITVANATSNTVTVSLPTEGETYYELSTDDETFGSTPLTLELDEANHAYFSVRLKAGLTVSTNYDADLTVSAEGADDKTISLYGYVSEESAAAITVYPESKTVSQDEQIGSLEITTNKATTHTVFYCPAEAEGVDAVVTYPLSEGQSYYPWVTVELSENGDSVHFYMDANTGEERSVYFRVYGNNRAKGHEGEVLWSKLIKITQHAYVTDYATLPFEFSAGRADIEETEGMTQSGLGSDYKTSPLLKFDTTGDNIVLKVNEAIGSLNFDIKGNSFSGGTFTVQVSVDGENYNDLCVYNSLSDTQSEEFTGIDSAVRYIKWVYTEKSSGNVGLGNIVVDAVPVTTTVSALGLATFASDYALDFSKVEGLEAYIALEGEGATALKRVLYVPAGTGLLLRAKDITEATEFSIRKDRGESVDDVEGNLFVRGTGEAVYTVADDGYNYVLSVKDGNVGFYGAAGLTVGTDKAYLHTSTNAAHIFFDFDETTGIRAFDNSTTGNSAIYDIQGRRVANPTRGLYIVNGKKVVIR